VCPLDQGTRRLAPGPLHSGVDVTLAPKATHGVRKKALFDYVAVAGRPSLIKVQIVSRARAEHRFKYCDALAVAATPDVRGGE
jgi:hypothetical protein